MKVVNHIFSTSFAQYIRVFGRDYSFVERTICTKIDRCRFVKSKLFEDYTSMDIDRLKIYG